MASTVYFYTMDCRTEHQNKESKVARLCNLLKLKDIVVPGRPWVNFHSKCKMLGGVAEFFSEAFLCRFPPEDLPRPVVYPVHSLPV